jgi:hypothetical protein
VAAVVVGAPLASPSAAATPPPTPPPLSTPATPQPDASAPPEAASTPVPVPYGLGIPGVPAPAASQSAYASPTPPPDARKGLEGVWELQLQRGAKTDYAHFSLAQTGTTLTGTYLNDAGKKFPLAGSVDGQSVRLVVTLSDGTSYVIEGRLDGTTDMVGILTTPKEQVPFSAAYRPKEKFIDNLNAAPGGVGGMGTGSGGYSPPR